MITKESYDIEQHNLAVQSHNEWLANIRSREFISKLTSFRDNLLHQAENLAVTFPINHEMIVYKLTEANQLKRLLTHIKNSDKYVKNAANKLE